MRHRSSKNTSVPVNSDDIKQAISSLDNLTVLTRELSKQEIVKSTHINTSSKAKSSKIPKLLVKRQETEHGQPVVGGVGGLANAPDEGTLGLEFYSKEDLRRRHEDMTRRLVDKAKDEASKRAEEYEVRRRLEEQKRVDEEERQADAMKRRHESKVVELQLRTAERVRELKRARALRARGDKEKAAAEAAARLEREAVARAQGHLDRIRSLRKVLQAFTVCCIYG